MALTRMQQRRGVASQWASENPILGSGEIGYEIDNNRFKIGDGVTNWSGLEYFSNKEDVDAAIASAIAEVIDLAPETLDTLNEIAAAINDDPNFFTNVVSKSGDTMTGDLTLPNDPTENLHAATKQYVESYADGKISDLISSGETITPGGTEGQVLAKSSDTDYDTEWVTPTGLLGDLSDVDTTGSADKDTLVYDDALGLWLPGPGGGRFNVSETPPTEPLNGDTWLDSITGNTYLYYEDLDSPQWIQIGGPGITVTRGSSLFVQTTSPGAPVEGDIWYDPTEGFTYLYYTDTDSSQWIQFGLNRNGAPGEPPSSIDEIADVNVSSPANGEVLEYNSSTSQWVTGTRPISNNAIINGDFGVWQRGTSFSANGYTADRWNLVLNGATGTLSRQSFTPADIEAVGYGDAEHYARIDVTGPSAFSRIEHRIEDVRTFSGQEVTFSFWAKADVSRSFNVLSRQGFGSGGSSINVQFYGAITIGTSWQRYSITGTVDSVSGKTIGDGSYLQFEIRQNNSVTYTLDTWGWQLEAGSVATPFRLAGGGSKGAELALCQRYYYRITAEAIPEGVAVGQALGPNLADVLIPLPKNFRIRPTAVEQSGTASDYQLTNSVSTRRDCTAVPAYSGRSSKQLAVLSATASDLTAGNSTYLAINNTDAYLGWDAEL